MHGDQKSRSDRKKLPSECETVSPPTKPAYKWLTPAFYWKVRKLKLRTTGLRKELDQTAPSVRSQVDSAYCLNLSLLVNPTQSS